MTKIIGCFLGVVLIGGCSSVATPSATPGTPNASDVIVKSSVSGISANPSSATPSVADTIPYAAASSGTPDAASNKAVATTSHSPANGHAEAVSVAYNSILQNKTKFIDVDNDNSKQDLNGFLASFGPDSVITVMGFTLIDLDDDKVPEAVIELSPNRHSIEFYEVFRYLDGTDSGRMALLRA